MRSAKKPEEIIVNIRKPTKEDYEHVPDRYHAGRPLLGWDTLIKIPSGIKRMHDWYMRAASVGIDTINVSIPPNVFACERQTAIITFEDMWLMMNLKRLDVQLITMFAV